MRSTYKLVVACLLATTASAVALPRGLPEPEPLNTTLLTPRWTQRYDQMRLLTCRSNRGAPRTDRIIAYYDHSPRDGVDKPTQIAYKEINATPSWEGGCGGHGKSTDGAEWKCDIAPYKWDAKKNFQKWMGTITYGYTGFNCFHDDGHATHYTDDGVCYAELYCTHERKQSLFVTSSKETAKIEYRRNGLEVGKNPGLPSEGAQGLVKKWFETIKEAIQKDAGDKLCSPTPVPLAMNCEATLECNGRDKTYLTKLVDGLIATYEHEKNDKGEYLYAGYVTKQCFRGPQKCDPVGHRCRYLPDLCDHVKGVEMPSKYTTSLESDVPPNADKANGEEGIQLGKLTVTIKCKAGLRENAALCGAMKTLFGGLSLGGPLATIFGTAAAVTTAACGDA